MLLNELVNPAVQAVANAVRPLWPYKTMLVMPDGSIQFRAAAGDQQGELDYKMLDHKLQNGLHQAGIQYKSAQFTSIAQTLSYTPIIAYVVKLS